MARWCSPKLIAERSTRQLSKLVNAWSITMFAIFEFLVSVWLYLFYFWFPDVVGNIGLPMSTFLASEGYVTTRGLQIVCLMVLLLRQLSALLGATAAWNRYVTRTRIYWMLLIFNSVLSIPFLIPIAATTCSCPHGVSGEEVNRPQCDAVRAYEWIPGALKGKPPPVEQPPPFEVNQSDSQLTRMLTRFEVNDAGVAYYFDRGAAVRPNTNCSTGTGIILSGDAGLRQRSALHRLQCGRSAPKDAPEEETKWLLEALQDCFYNKECGALELRLEPQDAGAYRLHTCGLPVKKVVPRLNQTELRDAIACARASWSCTDEPPDPAEERCRGFSVYLTRRREEAPWSRNILQWAFIWCTIINAVTMLLILILWIASVAFSVAVYKFFSTHCGDTFEMPPAQFPVGMENSRSQETSDEFEVGTFVSRTTMDATTTGTTGQSGLPSGGSASCGSLASSPGTRSSHTEGLRKKSSPFDNAGQAADREGAELTQAKSWESLQPTEDSQGQIPMEAWNTAQASFVSFEFSETPSVPMIFKESDTSAIPVEFQASAGQDSKPLLRQSELHQRKARDRSPGRDSMMTPNLS